MTLIPEGDTKNLYSMNGRWFYLEKTVPMTLQTAKVTCQNRGLQLATFEDKLAYESVQSILGITGTLMNKKHYDSHGKFHILHFY